MEKLSQIGQVQVMQAFGSEEEDLELDPLGDGEPAELVEDGGDEVVGSGVSEQACTGESNETWGCNYQTP